MSWNRTERPRLTSLDGLRGVAAFVVVMHHSLLVFPSVATDEPDTSWIAHTPLHIAWAGSEAVYVFFILSGLVLTLPSLRRSMNWISYYPARVVRLYLPVIASVALALLLTALVPRLSTPEDSVWIRAHDKQISPTSLIGNVTLVAPDWLNSPLWSLRWEILFSLLLPLYALLVTRLRSWWPLILVAGLALSAVGMHFLIAPITYLPMFMIGAALAVGIEAHKLPTDGFAWMLVTSACLLGITASWWLPEKLASAGGLITIAAAAGLVAAAACWTPARKVLNGSAVQWLGRVSFSLYLVHEPVVVSLGLAVPHHLLWTVPFLAPALSLLIAAIFFACIEKPAHRIAKRLGRFAAGKFRRRAVS